MSTSVNTELRAALVQGVVSCALAIDTAYPNVPFEKPAPNTPWAAVSVIPGPARVASLGDGGEDEHLGVLQIDLNYPLRQGEVAQNVKADVIASYFQAGRALVSGGTTVTVVSCAKSAAREVDGWYRVSMSINWYARARRT